MQEFPPASKLDSRVYGDQTSSIRATHIENSLDGLTIDEVLIRIYEARTLQPLVVSGVRHVSVSVSDTSPVLRFIFWTLWVFTCPCHVRCLCRCRCFIDQDTLFETKPMLYLIYMSTNNQASLCCRQFKI